MPTTSEFDLASFSQMSSIIKTLSVPERCHFELKFSIYPQFLLFTLQSEWKIELLDSFENYHKIFTTAFKVRSNNFALRRSLTVVLLHWTTK